VWWPNTRGTRAGFTLERSLGGGVSQVLADHSRDRAAHVGVGRAVRDADCVENCLRVRAAVGDDDLTRNAEQQRATGLAVVDPVTQRAQLWFEQRATDGAAERASGLRADAREQELADAFGRPGMAESRRAIGNNLEVVSVITTPAGPVVGVYVEGRDPAAANRSFAASTSEFDTWFKDQLRAIHPPFIDFNQPVQGIEEIFDSEAILARR